MVSKIIIEARHLKLYTESYGNPNDPAILLIAGAMSTKNAWTGTFCAKLVANGFFVIRYDHRDIGMSSAINWEKDPYTLTDLGIDAVDILNAYGIKKAHFIGHSMGGFICQRVAVDFPERVLSITAIGAGPIGATIATDVPLTPQEKSILENTWKVFLSRKDDSINGFLPIWQYLHGQFKLDEQIANIYTQDLLNCLHHQVHAGNSHELVMRHLDISKERNVLRMIQACALIIHGDQDPLSLPRNGIALAEAIPNSTLIFIPGMGHLFFNQELEEKISQHILQFIKAKGTDYKTP